MRSTIFGKPIETCSLDLDDISIDEAANFCKSALPDVWRAVNVKFIETPGSHHGFKALAVSLACAIGEMSFARKDVSAANNICAVAGVLARHNYPTYYVSASLLESLKRSSPPKSMTWAGLKLPFPGLTFMLPRGSLREPEGGEIPLVGITRFAADDYMDVPGTKIKVRGWREDRLSVFWGVGNCMTVQDCTFPETQPLEPEPDWITRATEEYCAAVKLEEEGPSAEFSSYVAGLVANLILVMEARPELLEEGGPTGKRLSSGLRVHRPNFIGRKYAVLRRERAEAGGKFTELDWRCGHFRRQHFGAERKDSKIIWIDPYIAYVRGLVPKEVA